MATLSSERLQEARITHQHQSWMCTNSVLVSRASLKLQAPLLALGPIRCATPYAVCWHKWTEESRARSGIIAMSGTRKQSRPTLDFTRCNDLRCLPAEQTLWTHCPHPTCTSPWLLRPSTAARPRKPTSPPGPQPLHSPAAKVPEALHLDLITERKWRVDPHVAN